MMGGTVDGTRQQVGDALLQDRVGRETDSVEEVLGFQKLVDIRLGEGGIPSEVAAQVPFPVALNDRLQNVAPAVGAVDVAGT